ncbi:MAG: hypothetical protein J0G32_04085 [Alphaproteobacteria bacterium]|nr:hypothetical protein [Alphaproteobacteria bacterium]OJV15993.1 MAG: hypothetical protein BGO27_04005 [Alphaproteobacteria bacterium 33-17]
MYDSPRTKLIKSVFDNEVNFLTFRNICAELEAKNSIVKIYDRELRDHYNNLKKEFRELFKITTKNFDIDFNNKLLITKITEILVQSIKTFAENFSANRMLPNKLNPLIIAREVSKTYISKIEDLVKNQALVFADSANTKEEQLENH